MSADALAADWPDGTTRTLLDSIDSTNAHALRVAPTVATPAWFLAAEQTGGRGRRGRPWSSARGNFYGTLLLRPDQKPETVALRSFAAALALRDACVGLTGLPDAFVLKWPNDVLLNGGKLAGILLESAGSGGKVAYLAIGIGVNLIAAPPVDQVEPGAVPPVSLLAETGHRIEPSEFLTVLAIAYARWEAELQERGFAPLRDAWLGHATRLGQTITARTGRETHTGVFETIDETGALVLATAKGRIAVPAADIFF